MALLFLEELAIRPNSARDVTPGIEIAFVTEDPEGAFTRAAANGAAPRKLIEVKPWGQKVGYVRDLNGCLVELCSPMTGG